MANPVTCVANNDHLLLHLLLALSAFGRLLGTWFKNRLNRVLIDGSLWWIV